jgi:hypothetical protein
MTDVVLGRAEIADRIKRTVAKRFKRKRRAVYFEMGVNRGGRLRADVLALAMNGHLVIVEVKSSVADFRADKKMAGYLPFCNQFYLATTRKVYKKIKDDIIDQAGVFIISDDGLSITKVMRARNRKLDQDISYNLAIRAAFRNSDTNNRKNVRA